MSSYGRIRRGPVAADILGEQFTQVWNRAVRDQRLSRRARGLLVELLSHRDGYGISINSLVAAGPEGRDAIRAALAELERYGYLHRVQCRDERGRLGETVYEITDMPEGVTLEAEAPWPEDGDESSASPQPQNRRSEPLTDLPSTAGPSTGRPTSGGPSTANPLHKKTNSKNTSGKNTLSLPAAPTELAAAGSRTSERETEAAPTSNARIVRAARVLDDGEDEAAFIAWVTARHNPRGPGWWRTVAANGDLADLAAEWRAQHAPAAAGNEEAAAGLGLPPWCGRCGDADQYAVGDLVPPAKNNPLFRKVTDPATGEEVPCPDCHPSAVAAEAA